MAKGKEQEIIDSQWSEVLKILEEKIPSSSFLPWISTLVPTMSIQDENPNGIFILRSNQAFGVNIIKQRYLRDIEDAIYEVSGNKYRVDVYFDEKLPTKKRKQTAEPAPEIATIQAKMENLKQMHSFCGLNLKYTFDNFVVGDNSFFAYNLAKRVAQAPGQKHNPLFIHGSVGIGKTHLMHAIGHSILRNFPDLKPKYVKAEEFMNQFIEAININRADSVKKMTKFRDTYRNVDVLLVDDVQVIEKKEGTQKEIFSIFDSLYYAGKQIVFAADRPIEKFMSLSNGLKSRFEWGVEVEITVPDFETRVAIIENYAKRNDFEISREISSLLAEIYDRNVRELEGAYNKISAWASIMNEELTIEKVKKILGCDIKRNEITIQDIIEKCAEYFKVTSKDIVSPSRSKEVAIARHCAIYLTREILDYSYPTIAKEFNRNHTTIIISYEKIQKDLKTNKNLEGQLEEIKKLLS